MQGKLRQIPLMEEHGIFHIMVYFPHHGVYHPHKPRKLRVIFDCSTELNGRLINKELFPGPGLANKLVGVLTKFRENQVAFMADIAKMCFQIFVAEQHRSLL